MASLVGDSFFGLDLSRVKSQFMKFRRRISKRVLLVEFGISSVNFAEVQVHNGSITLDHIRRYQLPEEALERGIPTDPKQMAALIQGHCEVEDIPAHRAAVVIPPDAAFTTLIQLPDSLASEDALNYVHDPTSSVQVPVQLDQMDVELIPLDLPQQTQGLRNWFLTAVPGKLINRLIETINLSDLELLRLQIGTISQLSLLAEQMSSLAASDAILHLELLRECSLATVVRSSGPIKLLRLTAIREFPEPESDAESVESKAALVTERQIVASDRYLPLSDLDLRRLVQEVKQLIADVELQFPWLRWQRMVLAGPNSAHPMLADLLQEAMGLPVELCRPLAVGGVGLVELKQPILMQRLGRLVGLGLSFLDTTAAPAEAPELSLPDPEIPPAPEGIKETPLAIKSPSISFEPLEPLDVELVQEPSATFEPEPEHELELDSVLTLSVQDSDIPELMVQPAVFEPESKTFADAELLGLPVADEQNSEISNATQSIFSVEDNIGIVRDQPESIEGAFRSSEDQPSPGSDARANFSQNSRSISEDSFADNDLKPAFLMGELLKSYQAKKDIQPNSELTKADQNPLYLSDDPSFKPSVARKRDSDGNGAG